MEAHHAQADRAFAQRRIFGAVHAGGRGLDEAGQHIVEHAQHVLDKALFLGPLVPGLDVERRQAADRGAVLAVMVDAGGQRDLAAQVGGVDPKAQLTLVLGQRPVHRVDVEDIGLAGLQPGFQNALPQLAGVDLAQDLLVLGAAQTEGTVLLHAQHELVGNVNAVMQVQPLAVEVARRLADLQELLDLGMGDVEIDRGRTTAQRTLADRQGQAVHHMDEGDDAAGLAGLHLLADGADLAPIGADAAAIGRQPDILVPGADDAIQRVRHIVEEAGNRQAAIGAAIRQNGRGRHEPQPAHIVVQPLGMADIVRIGAGDAGKHVLEAFARHEIAVAERGLAESRQQRVARMVEREVGGLGPGRQRIRQRRLGIVAGLSCTPQPLRSLSGRCATELADAPSHRLDWVSVTVRVTTTERSITRSAGDWTICPLLSKSPSRMCLPSADIFLLPPN